MLHPILDGEHASMATVVGPEEPAAGHEGADEQDPASNGGFGRIGRSGRTLWSCFPPREIL